MAHKLVHRSLASVAKQRAGGTGPNHEVGGTMHFRLWIVTKNSIFGIIVH